MEHPSNLLLLFVHLITLPIHHLILLVCIAHIKGFPPEIACLRDLFLLSHILISVLIRPDVRRKSLLLLHTFFFIILYAGFIEVVLGNCKLLKIIGANVVATFMFCDSLALLIWFLLWIVEAGFLFRNFVIAISLET